VRVEREAAGSVRPANTSSRADSSNPVATAAGDAWFAELQFPSSKSATGSETCVSAGPAVDRAPVPITLDGYVALVECLGQAKRPGTARLLPRPARSLVERLGLLPDALEAGVRNFGVTTHLAAGSQAAMREESVRRGLRWLRGVGTVSRLYRRAA
jgi:hypothetical protein